MNKVVQEIIEFIKKALVSLEISDIDEQLVMLETPKNKDNGDYSSNIAMRLTKILKKNPYDIALLIKEELEKQESCIDKVEVAKPGFLNFWVKKDELTNIINVVLEKNNEYGKNDYGKTKPSVLVEYISANPTGILHLGHARGAAWGDCLTRLYNACNYNCLREYYINDAGAQIYNLALSLLARYKQSYGIEATLPEDGYHGDDVLEIMEKIKAKYGDKLLTYDKNTQIEIFTNEGVKLELDRIKEDLAYFNITMDSWISEKEVATSEKIEALLKTMKDKNLLYEKENALWFKSSVYGDDKDRVLVKSDGLNTYLTPDIVNHVDKIKRGYQHLINLWGADHHGYIPRMKAALKALGYKDILEVDVIQMVRLVEDGVEVKMSKRSGNAITIRELIDDIGVDAARYFFVSRALDTHLDFDLALARKKSSENPVFYAQYAHARICSIFDKGYDFSKMESYPLLVHEKESLLLKQIGALQSVVIDATIQRAPNKICNYIHKLAQSLHSYYASCKIVDESNKELMNQRLALLKATQITLANALNLIGVSAPNKM